MESAQPPAQTTYVRSEVVDDRSSRPPRRGPRSALGCFVFLLLIVLGGSLLANFVFMAGSASVDSGSRVEERHFSHNRLASNKIAIITVEGTIVEGRGFVKRQIERARKDDNIKAIVLRVNSPGGTVSGSDYILHHLNLLSTERQVPIVVSMGSLAASGGYYVSMAVGTRPNTIFAEPTTWTGSIGVLIPHFNVAKLMETWGIESDSVVSHRLKGMGSFTRAMTPEERKIFQALVDDAFTGFKNVIKEGRPKFKADPAALDKIATGQVFTAQQAVANGLVDKVGFVEDAVVKAVELCGLPSDDVNVVEYKPEFSFSEILLGSSTEKHSAVDLDALVDLTVPKAFYLYGCLPPVVENGK